MTTRRIKSALPLYGAAAVWLVFGFILPIYKLWAILLTLAISVAAALLLGRVFPGREVEVVRHADSGDAEVDRQIEEGRATLRRIHDSNVAIPDEVISAQIQRMEDAGAAIFDELEKDVSKAAQVRRFMNYYLPTADKLLNHYSSLSRVAGGENVNSALKSIENSMEMIAVAFEKQLDALYKDSALDIETDIQVLETMINADGHAEKGTPLGGMR